MTKKRIVELLIEACNGSRLFDDKIGQYHPELMATYLTPGWQKAINAVLKSDGNTSSLDQFTVIDRGLDLIETSSGEKMVVLKNYKPMNIHGNDGIRAVYPSGTKNQNLWYRNRATAWIQDELYGAKQNPAGVYDFIGSSIFIECDEPALKYDVVVVPEFYSLGDKEEVPMPQRFETELIEMTKAMILNTPPPDNANDSR